MSSPGDRSPAVGMPTPAAILLENAACCSMVEGPTMVQLATAAVSLLSSQQELLQGQGHFLTEEVLAPLF